MVKFSLVKQSNNEIDETSAPHIAVFVGGTSGIGKLTLGALSGIQKGLKAYVFGRKEKEESFKAFSAQLSGDKSNTEIIWIEAEVSRLTDVKRVCDHIKTLETKIDLLFMTTGYAPFGGREDTPEGIDTTHALSHYSRICFTENLLPLLRASGHARVISVLGGGMERESLLDITDLNLDKPNAFGPIVTQGHMAIMNTLTLERLAEMPENHSVVFIHSYPGFVRTGNLFRGWKEGSWGAWLAVMVFDPLMSLFAFSLEESARRHLYQVTSGAFGGHGPLLPGIVGKTTRSESAGGLFLVNHKCDSVLNEKEMGKLRVKAQDVVWNTTQDIIGPYVKK